MAAKNSAPAADKKKYTYVTRTWVDDFGEKHWVRGKTEREAADKLAELKLKFKLGEVGVSENMTLKAWSEEWLKTYVRPKVRIAGAAKNRNTMTQKSYEMYLQKINNHIIPALGNLRLKEVKRTHLQSFLNSQVSMSESHVKKLRMILKAMFSEAVRDRLLVFNPADGLSIPAVQVNSRRSLTDKERSTLLAVGETHRCGLWMRFLLGTGIRPGESAPLLISDFTFVEKGISTVRISKSIESGTEKTVGPPKTDAGFRTLPIPDDLVPDLIAAAQGRPSSAYMFPQTDGKSMMTTTSMSNNWRSFSRQMDLAMGAEHTKHGHIYDPKDIYPDGTPMYPDKNNPDKPRNGHKIAPDLVLYCLRHTYCTDLQRAGVPLNIARQLMGHSDIAVTAAIYTHGDDFEVNQAGNLINAYRKSVENEPKIPSKKP